MASSPIPATIDTPFKDNGQNNLQSSRSPRKRGSSNSLTEQAGSGPVSLPPLHPKQSNNDRMSLSFIRSRTGSDYDNDSVSVMSTGSSVVPVDAGQHGFITYNDDASSTGSLVLGYEQGRDVPPAAYDLPAAIFNVYNPNNNEERLIGEGLVPNRYSFNSLSVKTPQSHPSQRSETDSVLLPYHVRTKLNASQHTMNYSESEAANTQVDAKAPPQITGYGSIEAGLAPPVGYYDDDDDGQQQQNIAFDPSVSAYNNPYHSPPMCDPYEEPSIKYNGQNASVSGHSPQKESSNGIVYVSMLIALVLFVVAVYVLFYIMKRMH